MDAIIAVHPSAETPDFEHNCSTAKHKTPKTGHLQRLQASLH